MRFFRKLPIKYRLIVVFLLVSIVPLILIGYFSYLTYSNSFLTKIRHSTNETLSVLRQNVETELEKYEYLNGMISVDPAIQTVLQKYLENSDDINDDNIIEVDDAINEINGVLYPPYVKNIRVTSTDGEILYDLGYDNLSAEQLEEILDDCEKSSPLDSWTYVKTFRKVDILVCTRKVNSIYSLNHLGYIMIFVDEGLFSYRLFSDIDLGSGSSLTLMNNQGIVFSTTGNDLKLGQPYPDSGLITEMEKHHNGRNIFSFDYDLQNGRYMICAVPLSEMGCYLVATIPFTYIYSETNTIRMTIFLVLSILIIISLAFILFLYRSILSPIKGIEKFCYKFSSGILSERIQDSSQDEMGILSQNINLMANKIELLMEQQKQDQKRKRKLELQMLQYQINPHFLFNSLNTLKWIAVINKVPVVSNGISALANLLKSTIVNKDEYIPLQDEIHNLRNYFEIQKMRYANCFNVCYELDESLLTQLVPKFILQPLAENSILHGIDNDFITITIRCYSKEETLIIEVADNGKGFDIENTEKISSKKMTGIGISNVDDRLKLSFGQQYGLIIQSKIGKGTLCRLYIPLNFHEKQSNES